MQFASLLPITSLFLGMAAAGPHFLGERQVERLHHHLVNDALKELEANGQVNWTNVEGGQLTFITHAQGLTALNNLKGRDSGIDDLHTRSLHARWEEIGPVEGYITEQECYKSGTTVLLGVVKAHFPSACSAFFGTTTVGATVDAGWNIFKTSPLLDVSGAQAVLKFKWANSGLLEDVKPTEAVCNVLAEELLGGSCVGTGQTKGADIRWAQNHGIVLGYDPDNV